VSGVSRPGQKENIVMTYFLEKSANIEDAATGLATEELVFRKVGGGCARLALPRSDFRDPNRVLNALLDRNARLPDGDAALELINKAIESRPEAFLSKARTFGWQRKGYAFVHPAGVIEDVPADGKGKRKGARRSLRLPGWVNEKHDLTQRRRGKVRQWKKLVAARAVYSSAALIAICAAFAAPLLKLTGLQSFGINLFGISKAGKTTALLAGASVGGIGEESELPNHKATAAAKRELARIFNDQMLGLNEVGLIAGTKRDAYPSIRELIYDISEGKDRTRLSTSQTAVAAYSARFRTIFVSTAERSFDAYARAAGESRDEGEYARCMDVAATREGEQTIMDRLDFEGTRIDRRQAARQQTRKLRKACRRYHGAAFERYVRHLIAQESKLKGAIRAHMKTAKRQITEGLELDGALLHAANNFALLYAGGAVAVEAKLLPIAKETLLDVIATAFQRSCNDLQASESQDAAIKRILRARLTDRQVIPSVGKAGKVTRPVQGFRRKREGTRYYTIRSTDFRSWFDDDNLMIDAALNWLDAKGVLKRKGGRKQRDTRAAGIDWAVQQVRWPRPNGKKGAQVRSIVFAYPFAS
jgi:putative DNA primase/helicase